LRESTKCIVEALAGETKMGSTFVTNHSEIEKILGKELHEKLYKYGSGLRNKLLHGNFGAHHLFDGLTDDIYNKLVSFLRITYDIQIQGGLFTLNVIFMIITNIQVCL